jgi:hypothetical protein
MTVMPDDGMLTDLHLLAHSSLPVAGAFRPALVPDGHRHLVLTRGTPPQEEGCRPASRGLTLTLMT